MPRKPRIEIAGYYHIINRGVEQRVIFKEDEDYQYFIELLCLQAKKLWHYYTQLLPDEQPLSSVD